MPTMPCDPADVVSAALAEGRPPVDGLLALQVFAAQGCSWAAQHRQGPDACATVTMPLRHRPFPGLADQRQFPLASK